MPYPAVQSPGSHDRLLVVAPHMDDEAIGAAAYAFDALGAGGEVFVAFLTAGDAARLATRLLHRTVYPGPEHYMALGRRRIAEARRAMSVLGIGEDHHFVLGYPDRALHALIESDAVVRSSATRCESVPYDCALSPGAAHTISNIVADLVRVIEIARPTIVVAPASYDYHSDHRAAARLLDLALARSEHAPQRLGYVVHASRLKTDFFFTPQRPLLPASHLRGRGWATHGVSAAARKIKEAMLQAYESQRAYMYLLRNACIRSNELFLVAALTPEPGSGRYSEATLGACAGWPPPRPG